MQWRLQEWIFKLSNKSIRGAFFYRNYGGSFKVGHNILINSTLRQNPTSFGNKTAIIVFGELCLGNYVGISSSIIHCSNRIVIGDHVLIGSNSKIFDTDFHDINSHRRIAEGDTNIANGTISIGDGVFIGANSIIGKNTVIGDGAVIGAGSVVFSQIIPEHTIWAGNPAQYIRDV